MNVTSVKKKVKKHVKELVDLKQRLVKVKQAKREELKLIECETAEAIKDIDEFRALIGWVLDKLEKKGKEYVEKRQKELSKGVIEDIERCEGQIESIDKRLKYLAKAKGDNHTKSFVEAKKRKETLQQAKSVSENLKCNGVKPIVKFTVDPKVEKFARNLAWYGKDRTYLSFERPLSFPHPYEVKHTGQFDIRTKGDIGICNVVDSCQLKDGTLLLADHANRRLKQLDVLYQLVGTLDMPQPPTAVDVMDEERVLVALDGGSNSVLQIVNVGLHLKLGDSFVIPKRCTAITCGNGAIFVASAGVIYMYSTKGELVRDIYNNAKSSISSLAMNSKMTKIHFMDTARGLVTVTTDGEEVGVAADDSFSGACAVTSDANGHVFTGCRDSHVISQFSHDLTRLGVIATGNPGFRHPQSLTFDRLHKRLVVSVKSKNVIKVFELQ